MSAGFGRIFAFRLRVNAFAHGISQPQVSRDPLGGLAVHRLLHQHAFVVDVQLAVVDLEPALLGLATGGKDLVQFRLLGAGFGAQDILGKTLNRGSETGFVVVRAADVLTFPLVHAAGAVQGAKHLIGVVGKILVNHDRITTGGVRYGGGVGPVGTGDALAVFPVIQPTQSVHGNAREPFFLGHGFVGRILRVDRLLPRMFLA